MTKHSHPVTWGSQRFRPTPPVPLSAALPFSRSCLARFPLHPSFLPSFPPSSLPLACKSLKCGMLGTPDVSPQGTQWFLGREIYKSPCHLALRGMRGGGKPGCVEAEVLVGVKGLGLSALGGGVPSQWAPRQPCAFPREPVIGKELWSPAPEARGGLSTVSLTWEGWQLQQRGFLATDEPRRRPRPDLIKLKPESNRSP